MKDRKAITAEARRFVAATQGALGPRPIEAVVREHLPFFDGLQGTGASWDQMARLLADAGLRSRRGMPVRASVLRAAVSRARHTEVEVVDVGDVPTPRRTAAERGVEPSALLRRVAHATTASQAADRDGLDAVRTRMARAARMRGGDE